MIALLYLALLVYFGDALASRWFSFVSLPHRVATGFLVGLLTGTWISYLAALLASGASDPMAVGGLASALVMLVAAIWLRRTPSSTSVTPVASLRSVPSEWLFVLAVVAVAGAMMLWTYHYDQGTLYIAGDLWSDFGPTSAISQSFALGHNFPTQYPHFGGEPIRYHFLYYFQVGNLTFLGLDPATANNLLSIASMVALLVVVAALGERLFGSRLVGWLGVGLFFAHGALSFIPYLGSFPSVIDGIASVPDLGHFLASGFPYRGEEWGVWTQDVFLNQRHLPSAIGILLVIVLFLMSRLPEAAHGPAEPGFDGTRRRMRVAISEARRRTVATLANPAAAVWSALRDPWLPGYALCGLLAGLLPLYNGAMFIASAVVLGILFVVFPNRLQMIVLAIGAAIPAVPQLLFLRPGTMAGEQTYPAFYWGYTVDDPTPIRVATYMAFIFGPKLILAAVGLLAGTWRLAWLFVAFAALVGVAFLVQLSVEVLANHKFINTWLIVANLFVAYGLVRLWQARPSLWVPTRLVAAGLAAVIVVGGVIDLFPIKNQRMYQAGVDGDPLYEWVRTATRPNDLFLSDFYVVHGILLAGRKLYLGWPYYSWSAGYAVGVREQWYREVFALRGARELVQRLQAAGIAYVAFDDGLRDRGFASKLNEEVFQDNLEMAFDDPDNRYGNLTIYRVPTDAAAAGALPDAPPEDMYVGGPGSAPGRFAAPRGLALDRSGAVYVADTGNDRIQKFSSSGNLMASFDLSSSGAGEIRAPSGVAVTSTGSMVVAAGERLVVLDQDGQFERELSAADLPSPNWVDVAIDRGDAIFALDAADGRVARFGVDGSTLLFGSPGSDDGQLRDPTGLGVRTGTVAVADMGNARIELFDGEGGFLETMAVAEWQDSPSPEADVAVDDGGTVWASSPVTNSVVVYRPDGTFARSIAPTDGEPLERPAGLALRPGGFLFVANAGGDRVSLLGSINP
jgi:sugar lactone lactonase YvrE